MGVATDTRVMQAQDGAGLKKLLGFGDEGQIPDTVLDVYYAMRQMKYRMIGGAMSPEMLVLVLHIAGEGDFSASAVKEEQPLPEFGEPIPDEGIAWVEGREYYVTHKAMSYLLPYQGRGPGGRLKFKSPVEGEKFIFVKEEDVRLKE